MPDRPLDPYTPDRRRYECRSCGRRTTAEEGRPTCPDCDEEMRNLSKPRE